MSQLTRDSSTQSVTRRNNSSTATMNAVNVGFQLETFQVKQQLMKIPGLNPIVDNTSSKTAKKTLARKQSMFVW